MKSSIRVMMPVIMMMIVASMSDAAGAYQRSNRSSKARELITAAAAGDAGKVLRLLNSGVNVNATFAQDESELSGKTALMAAASGGHSDLVSVLIKRRAIVDLKHYSGQTALMFAARGGDKSTIEALLRAGADVNATIVSPHAGEFTPLTITINTDHAQRFEVAKILLAARAQVNPPVPFLASPLMHALKDFEMVKLLIASGANVNQKNFRGATALMIASGAGSAVVVRYLLEKGADLNARDQDGLNALDYAEKRREQFEPSRDEIIQVLRKAQAESKPR